MALSLRLAAFLVLETPEVFVIFQPFFDSEIGITFSFLAFSF
jgi:hypothetical protein